MFLTLPTAEARIPAALASKGYRAWHVVEFALHFPLFLVGVEYSSSEARFVRHLLTANQPIGAIGP